MMTRLTLAVALLTLQPGCNSAKKETLRKELSHVRIATMLYNKAASDLGRVPKDEQEFKKVITDAKIDLGPFKVQSIDEIFVSDRDQQPLVIAYGGPPPNSDVVVYEQTGVDGKRLIGHRIGMVEEVDEAAFRELVPQ